jgi:hypothetical protein
MTLTLTCVSISQLVVCKVSALDIKFFGLICVSRCGVAEDVGCDMMQCCVAGLVGETAVLQTVMYHLPSGTVAHPRRPESSLSFILTFFLMSVLLSLLLGQ